MRSFVAAIISLLCSDSCSFTVATCKLLQQKCYIRWESGGFPTLVVIGHNLLAASQLLVLVGKPLILSAESGDHLL